MGIPEMVAPRVLFSNHWSRGMNTLGTRLSPPLNSPQFELSVMPSCTDLALIISSLSPWSVLFYFLRGCQQQCGDCHRVARQLMLVIPRNRPLLVHHQVYKTTFVFCAL